jgi:hypothetical protein
MPRPAPSSTPTDLGSARLAHQRKLRLELTGRGHAVRARVVDGCELDRLRALERITSDQHSAGDTLARALHRAGMLGTATSTLIRVARTSASGRDSHTDALAQVSSAITYLDWHVGTDARAALLAVLLEDARPRTRAALDLVRAALDALLLGHGPRNRAAPAVDPLWA